MHLQTSLNYTLFFNADKENDPYQEKEKRKKSETSSSKLAIEALTHQLYKGILDKNKFLFHKYFSSGELSNYI